MTSIQFRRLSSCSHTHSCFGSKLYVLAWSGQKNSCTTRPAEFCACCGARKAKDTIRNNRPIARNANGLVDYALCFNVVVHHSSGRQADRYTGPMGFTTHLLLSDGEKKISRCDALRCGKKNPEAPTDSSKFLPSGRLGGRALLHC